MICQPPGESRGYTPVCRPAIPTEPAGTFTRGVASLGAAILGSTGSIGQSALSVVDAHPERLQVVGLAAGENVDRLAAQIAAYRPRIAAVATGNAADRLRDRAERIDCLDADARVPIVDGLQQ